MAEKTYLSIEEVATRFGINSTTVYRLAQKGKLPGFKLGGQWRFSQEMLDSWVAAIAPNITGRKQLAKELQEKARALEAANVRLTELSVLRDEFIANVNHELRTPLTAIKEGISLILDGVLGPTSSEQKDLLDTVDRNVDRLGELVNSLLDLSKIEAGRLRLYRRRLSMGGLIESFLKSYKTLAGERRVEIDLHPTREAFADSERIFQVLGSLFSNAVKFTKEDGTIRFIVWEEDARPGRAGGTVAISVQDDGAGIAKEDLPQLFQKFSQVGEGKARFRGTGLGLALCRELIEMHRGTVSVQSEPGKGSTFTFTLPLYTPDFALEEGFREALQFAKQSSGKTIGVVAMDVRSLVAQYPVHLDQVAELVRRQVHHGDVVVEMEPDWVVVLAVADKAGVQAIADRLLDFSREHGAAGVGAALYPEEGTDIHSLFSKARQTIGHGPSEVAHAI